MSNQTPTIGQQTMICALEFGLPRQARQLKFEAAKIEEKAKAQAGTVRPPSATYFRKKNDKGKEEIDGLELLKDLQNEYKQLVMTLARYPYAGGFYLAPAGVVDELLKLKHKFEEEKKPLIWAQWAGEVYPDWLGSAPERMGAMYNEDDFPKLADCKKRFRMELIVLPLAEKDQVARITLISPSSKDLLVQHADKAQKEAMADLRKQIWNDFMTPLKKVVEVFGKDKPKVYETLLGNLMTIVNVIPSYKDLFNDPNLEEAAQQVKDAFGKMTTEDLRKSDDSRKVAFAAAQKMVAAFDPFAREFTDDKE